MSMSVPHRIERCDKMSLSHRHRRCDMRLIARCHLYRAMLHTFTAKHHFLLRIASVREGEEEFGCHVCLSWVGAVGGIAVLRRSADIARLIAMS